LIDYLVREEFIEKSEVEQVSKLTVRMLADDFSIAEMANYYLPRLQDELIAIHRIITSGDGIKRVKIFKID
jgi:hypothetical protein